MRSFFGSLDYDLGICQPQGPFSMCRSKLLLSDFHQSLQSGQHSAVLPWELETTSLVGKDLKSVADMEFHHGRGENSCLCLLKVSES